MKIGIVAQDLPDGKFGTNVNYLQFIANFGHPVMILPIEAENYIEAYSIDALLLPGGSDVSTNRYENAPKFGVYSPNNYLEHFDTKILPMVIGEIPIFGICRGLQTLNVFFGGTLKNLYLHPHSIDELDTCHKIVINGDKKHMLGVNSFHHQAIDKIAANFKVEAISEESFGGKGVIEAISDYNNSIFAVQWHPERLKDEYSLSKFETILNL